ncbi:hypothetical protein ACFFNY_02610 [Paenibacillus hodogayensis]|uniref:Uncharacterized protein n=1 Tax=Paenibacillus hodogayensis TaxID=279208 RepID=A0ABV5VQA3_9BACL
MERIRIKRKTTVGIDLLEVEWNGLEEIGQKEYEELSKYNVWNFSLERYIELALEKWQHFADIQARRPDEIILLDSSIFQFQIYSFLLANATFTQIRHFLKAVFQRIEALQPTLLYLYRDNVEDTIGFLEKVRGSAFLHSIWLRDRHRPYYQTRPAGAEGYKDFLRSWAMKLFEWTPFPKKAIDITDGDWKGYTDEMLTFFNLDDVESPEATFPNGTYRNDKLQQQLLVRDNILLTPHGAHKKLLPKSEHEFYISDIPVTLGWTGDSIIIGGEPICERWTTWGTVFDKI